ncbi:hypothetical protein DPMN_126899 [Dreissena polymorpha]|uniref:Uncharacterized protein n=1 Tax=Dreissena polymorpha TaxID=45954 RepID=A0A9D4JYC6_DREPO|nr:hypothetical protein DPMN_126899 [Dreissena polymorpha]
MEVNFLKLLTKTAWNVSQREASGSVTTKTPNPEQMTEDMSRLRTRLQKSQESDPFPVRQGPPEISAAANVVADRCATPGSKCCIQIVHRLTKPIKLRL